MNREQLIKDAKSAGISPDCLKRLHRCNTEENLIQFYKDAIDFGMEHNFPSCGFWKDNSPNKEEYGIHVDETFTSKNHEFNVLLGSCDANLIFDGYTVAQAYVKDNSSVAILASDKVYVMIDCFDDSAVNIDASEKSKVVANVYGNAVVTWTDRSKGAVIVNQKNKACY
ncbi:hypothetical protein H8S90_21300 [Olivibacter sp. SDN3]|uniref:hypothetical protein n=1 Tax=Olivibacter sp. SDN3 TaxID=2764720 RepID=UPI001650D91C|nr:hypothetical protein [Olivibacter sp. SDN3]QNL49249.1 hypothetical protein H8S90_21300 [Olivibacter sp. SDN3]